MEEDSSPQRVWKTEYLPGPQGRGTIVRAHYVDGPDLSGMRGFKSFCDVVPGSKTSGSSNVPGANSARPAGPRRTGQRPRQLASPYARLLRWPRLGLASGEPERTKTASSELWLTTYSSQERRGILRSDYTVFHIHAAPPSMEQESAPPSFLQKIGLMAVPPPAVDRLQALSTWQRVEPHAQAVPVSGRDKTIITLGRGAAFRLDTDVLYLDKTFWKQYFRGSGASGEGVLLAGVDPGELSKVQRLAVDIAVLRNKDEFSAVARALRRHLPSITNFWAMTTTCRERPEGLPGDQVATVEKPLPFFVDPEQRVRLGIHQNTATETFVPGRGIVCENLSRLNSLTTSNCSVDYVLLAYFNDSFDNLSRGTFDVDYQGPSSQPWPLTQSEPAVAPSPGLTTTRNANPPSPQTERPPPVRSPGSRPPAGTPSQASPPASGTPESRKGAKKTPPTSGKRPVTAGPEAEAQQPPASNKAASGPQREERYNADFVVGDDAISFLLHDLPDGWDRLPTTSYGQAECGFEAIRISWRRCQDRLAPPAPGTPFPAPPTMNQFREAIKELKREGIIPANAKEQGYLDEHIARVFYRLLARLYGPDFTIQLGMVSRARHVDGNTIYIAQLFGLPDDVVPTSRRIWISNGVNDLHYEGIMPKPGK